MMGGVCLFVRLSVACLDLSRERKDFGKPKIDKMEAHHTGNPWAVNLFRGQKVKGHQAD